MKTSTFAASLFTTLLLTGVASADVKHYKAFLDADHETITPVGLDGKAPSGEGDFTFDTDWSFNTESNTTLALPSGATIYNERLYVDGVTKWRGNANFLWRKSAMAAGVSAYYIGSFADSLATTTAANYALYGDEYIVHQYTGNADVYRYRVDEVTYFNAFGSYSFERGTHGALSDTSIRIGANNLTDEAPPVSSGNFGFGYTGAVHGALVPGRTFTFEFVKRF